jgi:hypothetical protein
MNIRGLLLVLAVSVACLSDALATFINGNQLNSWIQARARIEAGNPQLTDYQNAASLRGMSWVYMTAGIWSRICPCAG